MSIVSDGSFHSIQQSENAIDMTPPPRCVHYEILNAFLGFDITLSTFRIASSRRIRDTKSSVTMVHQFKEPNERFSLTATERQSVPYVRFCLYEDGLLRLQWSSVDNKRLGHFFFYERGVAKYEGIWGDATTLLENTKSGTVMVQLNPAASRVVYRGGYHPTSYKRNGWGCEYHPASGELKCCGQYENGECVRVEKEFRDGKMIEYSCVSEAVIGPRQIIYLGEYMDDFFLHYPRNGHGVEVNPKNGVAIWDGEWKKGEKLQGMECNDYGWFMPAREALQKEAMKITAAPSTNQLLQIKTFVVDDNTCNQPEFDTLSLDEYRCLQEVRIGSNSCHFVSSFHCSNLQYLKVVGIGSACFSRSPTEDALDSSNPECVFHNNPQLKCLSIGNSSFIRYQQLSLRSACDGSGFTARSAFSGDAHHRRPQEEVVQLQARCVSPPEGAAQADHCGRGRLFVSLCVSNPF